MSVFAQVGRRADGRLFVVEDWVHGPMARIAHLGGAEECVALTSAERATIELVLVTPSTPRPAAPARAA